MSDLQKARQKCAEARKILQTARSMKGNRGLVVRALELYQDVLKNHAHELSEPFAALAQIAWSAGERESAFRFVQAGIELHPRNARLQQLRTRMDQAKQAPATEEAPVVSKPVSVENPIELVNDLGPEADQTKVSQGDEIVLLQKALSKAGYVVPLTGEFDRNTYAAVRTFQSSRKLPVTGSVDAPTREALNPIARGVLAEERATEVLLQAVVQLRLSLQTEADESLKQMAWELIMQLISVARQELPPDEEKIPPPDLDEHPREPLQSRLGNMGQMGIVSKGWEVIRLQQVLAREGFPVKINGTFDLQTFSELSRFQLQHKLPVNGLVEAATREHINSLVFKLYAELDAGDLIRNTIEELKQVLGIQPVASQEIRLRLIQKMLLELVITGKLPAPPPELMDLWQLRSELGPANRPGKISQGAEVRLLQQALKRLGFKADITGQYDNETYAAVRSFQISRKLPMNGLLDAKTRDELNPLLLNLLSS
ncbi:MAG: peptidoglycan-binding protein [Candidatus Sericytochromatia bacterium]|nr:peptidoglycan-binding protein [Candidatus Sericytochromatia bacterium]